MHQLYRSFGSVTETQICYPSSLSSDMSKSYVYKKYADSSKRLDRYYFSCRKFEEIWHELRPYVMTNKPASDLCLTCQLMTS